MSISAELEKLDELHRRSVLSDAEFTRAKARLLGDDAGVGSNSAAAAINSLRRSRTDRWLGGVCGGLARISGPQSWVWRLIFALLVLCGGTGVLVYLLLWIFVPEEDVPVGAQRDPAHAG